MTILLGVGVLFNKITFIPQSVVESGTFIRPRLRAGFVVASDTATTCRRLRTPQRRARSRTRWTHGDIHSLLFFYCLFFIRSCSSSVFPSWPLGLMEGSVLPTIGVAASGWSWLRAGGRQDNKQVYVQVQFHEPAGRGARVQKASPVAACASPSISSRRVPALSTATSVAGPAASHGSAAIQISHACPRSLPLPSLPSPPRPLE